MKGDPRFKATLDKLATLGVGGGLRTKREKLLLWNAAKQTKEGAIVEIGSFEGYSTIILAEAVEANRKVFAIDPFIEGTEQKFNENICRAGVASTVEVLKLKSEEAALGWAKPIKLLFIDGSHQYEYVKKDVLLWKPHLMSGARTIFHDINIYDVRRVVREYVIPDHSFGQFFYTPWCMFTTTFHGKSVQSVLSRKIWQFVLSSRLLDIAGEKQVARWWWVEKMLRRL